MADQQVDTCEHAYTEFSECIYCGAVIEHKIISCPKPPKRVDDPEYMTFVRGLVCCAILLEGPRCSGGIAAHHARGGIMARKADDSTCIALCAYHHLCWHDLSGPFSYWDKAKRHDWSDAYIEETRAMWRERRAYVEGAK